MTPLREVTRSIRLGGRPSWTMVFDLRKSAAVNPKLANPKSASTDSNLPRVFLADLDEKVDVAGHTGMTVNCDGVSAHDEVVNVMGI